ncbi:MAG: hypothetical protein ACR2QV_03570 [Gammaproteobacteria bacterium]
MDTAIVRKIAADCFRWDAIDYPRSDILTIAHDTDRSLLVDGKWYSPLIDTIEDDLRARGIECVSVARIASRIKGAIAHGRVYSPDGQFARALLGKRVKAALSRRGYPYSRMEESVWARIVDRVRPTKLFGIQPSRELCTVCKQRGIWVADVQHGIIGEAHPWYGEEFRRADPPAQVPDAFLCWDNTSAAVIDAWAGAQGAATVTIGNRWLARFLDFDPRDALVNRLNEEFESSEREADSRPAILVALSWGEVNIPNGFIVDGLRDAIRSTSDRYRWHIRLHPNQVAGFASDEGKRFIGYFNEQLRGHAEWEAATRSALPVVLAHSDLVISWNSSVSIEATQMGIPSAQLDPRFRSGEFAVDNYADYRKGGLIELVEESSASIQQWAANRTGLKRASESLDAYDDSYDRLLNFLAGNEATCTA